jgi:putative membrane protein
MVLFGGGLITLVVWAVTRLTRPGSAVSKHDALDLAKERYAKGEISKEEYEQYRKDLS